MQTFCYLNKMFKDENGKLTHAQLVINKRFDLSIETKIIRVEQLKDLYNRNKDNKDYIFDFSVNNDLLSCDTSIRVEQIKSEYAQALDNTADKFSPVVLSIYDLFTDIVNCKGLYIDFNKADVLGTEEMMSSVVRFIPNFSRTSMTVSLSVPLEDGWRTRKLIYSEEGKLKTSNFYFMVNRKDKSTFEKYQIEFVMDCSVMGAEYSIFQYTGYVPIYAYLGNDFRIYPSIINKYVYLYELYNMYLGNAKYIKRHYEIIDETELERPTTSKPKDYTSKYTQSYVYFEPSFKRITNRQREDYIEDIFNVLFPALRNGEGTEFIQKHLKEVCSKGGNLVIQRLNYLHILQIFRTSEGSQSALINKCDMEIEYYNELRFRAGNFLYALRSCMFIFNKGYNTCVALRGSDVPSSTFIRKGGLNTYEYDK